MAPRHQPTNLKGKPMNRATRRRMERLESTREDRLAARKERQKVLMLKLKGKIGGSK